MTPPRSRWPRFAALAGTAGCALALTSMLTAALAFGDGDDTALVMGGSGMPIPPDAYIDDVNDTYIGCDDDCATQGLFTPEGLYPFVGVKELPFDTSTDQGVTILNDAIDDQIEAGNATTVLGYSQSGTIESLEMRDLADGSAGIDPDPDDLHFVMLGDPSLPNGGMLERFDIPEGSEPSIPSLGITFSGATPADSEYPTDIYTYEYDGFADFPKYPVDSLSTLNALLGIVFEHTQYSEVTPDQLEDAVEQPTSDGYDGETSYHIIPTDDLPLLDPLRSIPGVGPVMSDLMEPELKVLVNLGYGDPEYGWVNEDADVPTNLGFLPDFDQLAKVPELLVDGAQEGIENAVDDLQDPDELFSLDNNPLLNLLDTEFFAAVANQDGFIPDSDESSDGLTGIVNAFSDAGSDLYAALLPTADITNALVTTLPSYGIDVIADDLQDGDLLGAIADPISALSGLLPVAGMFELAAVGEGLAFAAVDLVSPFVDVGELLP